MKRIVFVAAAILALATGASAQEASLTSPVARGNVTKIKVDQFVFSRPNSIAIRVVYQDATDVDAPVADLPANTPTKFTIPSAIGQPCTSATTINGMAAAMNNSRTGETGSDGRKQQFRILGYLVDQGCITGVTLIP